MYVGRTSRTEAGRVIKKLSIQYQVQQQELKRVDDVDNRLAFGASDPGHCQDVHLASCAASPSAGAAFQCTSKSSACRHRLVRPA
jgi:hypothetical protein